MEVNQLAEKSDACQKWQNTESGTKQPGKEGMGLPL